MNKNTLDQAKVHLTKLGFEKILNFKEIKEGRNSIVLRFRSRKKNYILKIYKHKTNYRIRRERLFYEFLNKNDIKQVVTPINFSIKNNIAIFPYINGQKIKRIRNYQIKELSNFLNKINNSKNSKTLPIATDGIQDRNYHIKLCEKKIIQLKSIKINSTVKKKFSKFLKSKIIPKFIKLNKNFKLIKKNDLPKMKLTKKEMIVSPSDFGFHNIIKKNKKLFFIDFEYAGLDDPIKLLCDFYCQPDQLIKEDQKKIFIKNLSLKNNDIKKINSYVKIFLSFHKLKWCCIMLNQFKNHKNDTNKLSIKKSEKLLQSHLIKTKIYFKKNLENK
jgi:thiamine kinase-like enzyme